MEEFCGKEGTVFIGNLSWTTDENSLWKFFDDAGVGVRHCALSPNAILDVLRGTLTLFY